METINKNIHLWVMNGLEKVMPFSTPPQKKITTIELFAAAGECEIAQIAVHAYGSDLKLSRPSISITRSSSSQASQISVSTRYVDLVPVRYQSQGVAKENLASAAPGFFPDPLCLEDTMVVPEGQTRSIWLTFNIPTDTVPGDYEGIITVHTDIGSQSVGFRLTVWPFVIPNNLPFSMTTWFFPAIVAKYHCVKIYSERFWKILEMYAINMQSHRQNVILTRIVGNDALIRIIKKANGQYGFDFTNFDRWVNVFLSHGFKLIEGSHLLGEDPGFIKVLNETTGDIENIERRSCKAKIVKYDEYIKILKALFTALRDHIQLKGWADNYIQHICDEPFASHFESYKYVLNFIRDIWPDIRVIDALGWETELCNLIEILVPQLGAKLAFQDMPNYKKSGKRFWTYTCNWPRGRFPNRYIDQKLILVRIIPWVLWRYGVTGYLSWAYAHWSTLHPCKERIYFDPFHDRKTNKERIYFDPFYGKAQDDIELVNPWVDTVLSASWSCPAGDGFMIYPPRDLLASDPQIISPELPAVVARALEGTRPKDHEAVTDQSIYAKNHQAHGPVDSIRWEQMREGIEDYGLLWLLSEKIKEAQQDQDEDRRVIAVKAKRTLESVMDDVAPDWQNYTRDPAIIFSARCRLAEAIKSLSSEKKDQHMQRKLLRI